MDTLCELHCGGAKKLRKQIGGQVIQKRHFKPCKLGRESRVLFRCNRQCLLAGACLLAHCDNSHPIIVCLRIGGVLRITQSGESHTCNKCKTMFGLPSRSVAVNAAVMATCTGPRRGFAGIHQSMLGKTADEIKAASLQGSWLQARVVHTRRKGRMLEPTGTTLPPHDVGRCRCRWCSCCCCW